MPLAVFCSAYILGGRNSPGHKPSSFGMIKEEIIMLKERRRTNKEVGSRTSVHTLQFGKDVVNKCLTRVKTRVEHADSILPLLFGRS